MEKRLRFNIYDSTKGCLSASIAPIAVSLFFAVFGVILCAILNMTTEELSQNTIYRVATNILTELSFLFSALIIAKLSKTNFIEGIGIKVTSKWSLYLIGIVLSVLTLFLLNPIISCWQELLVAIKFNIVSTLPISLDSVGNLFWAILVFALIPAICEEVLFRGVILNGLRKYGASVAILASATFFSLMHMNLQQLPYTFALGVLLGMVVYYTRNLGLSVLMHFLNNAIVLVLGYLTFNQVVAFEWYHILIGLVGVAIFLALLYFLNKYLKNKAYPNTQIIEQPFLDKQESLPKEVRLKQWLTPSIVAGVCLVIFTLVGFGVL